ncbi:DNA-binding response regulator [Dokdonia sinensis]|uniref:DNA-binding response regulator n=1 Tax=Dokdonia sinensis TaxID=2479847 RepID=A0A3M0G7Y2_9FLAO|nr:response regulator transcription factor [Dokdonia sinensis]RMB57139.1 DNA-binding response regulator [Dokdonia sinensis]
MYKVVIIEDNETLNEVFSRSVDKLDNFKIAATYLNCEDAIENFRNDAPDIVLMDIELPGMSGIQGTKEIKKIKPSTLIIMVTVFEHSNYVFDALCAGACGYLTKNATGSKIEDALNEAVQGGAPMSIQIAKMVVNSFQKAPESILTDRETEVLTLLSQGSSYKGVAIKMDVSPNTIKFHIKNIYDKLQVHDKESAIQIASDQKLI